MKIKLTKAQIEELAKNPDTKVSVNDPWWLILAKVIAYALGLILAGYGTTAAVTSSLLPFIN